VKEDEMDRVCSIHGSEEEFIQGFCTKPGGNKPLRMRWTRYVAYMEAKRSSCRDFAQNQKEINQNG
jgi:hypothetical protein